MNEDAGLAPYALVVDDNPTILLHAVDLLEEAGFRTLTAYNADEALRHLEEHGNDITLLFTDVEMPGTMDGFELANVVANRWPEVGILVASGRARAENDLLPEGAVFVGKPFSGDVIYDRIHQLLPDGKKPEPLKRKLDSLN